jgi:AbrB family looped-hinge helix DNA binding protein
MHTHEHAQQPPKRIVAGLTTKSDKIRALYREGYSRSEIRRILGIRYQHVRNVLVRDGLLEPRLSRPSQTDGAKPASRSEDRPEQVRVVVGPAGRVVIPAAYREVLGIDEGDAVVMRIEGDELHLISDATEVRRVREMIARYVPEGVSLVDELLRERRREVAADGSE